MSEPAKTEHKPETKKDGPPKPVIHRVCIGCNSMFTVSMDNYEAKHCPACHKG